MKAERVRSTKSVSKVRDQDRRAMIFFTKSENSVNGQTWYLSHAVYDESENRANMEMIQMCGENESLLVDAVLPD